MSRLGKKRAHELELQAISVIVIMFLVGLILFIDDVWLHFLGDLGHLDNHNPYTHHWMIGVALMLFAPILYYYLKK